MTDSVLQRLHLLLDDAGLAEVEGVVPRQNTSKPRDRPKGSPLRQRPGNPLMLHFQPPDIGPLPRRPPASPSKAVYEKPPERARISNRETSDHIR